MRALRAACAAWLPAACCGGRHSRWAVLGWQHPLCSRPLGCVLRLSSLRPVHRPARRTHLVQEWWSVGKAKIKERNKPVSSLLARPCPYPQLGAIVTPVHACQALKSWVPVLPCARSREPSSTRATRGPALTAASAWSCRWVWISEFAVVLGWLGVTAPHPFDTGFMVRSRQVLDAAVAIIELILTARLM